MALRNAKKLKPLASARKKALAIAKRGDIVQTTMARPRTSVPSRTRRNNHVTLEDPHSHLGEFAGVTIIDDDRFDPHV